MKSHAQTESPVFEFSGSPLDEARAYELLDELLQRKSMLADLAEFARIDDECLLGELIDSGFDRDTLPAIDFAPLVLTAWASTRVTEQENRVAMSLIYDARLYEFPAAMARVQSWLDTEPDDNLLRLWKRYTLARIANWTHASRRRIGSQIIEKATAIASASGGLMGIGAICEAEKDLIREIESVYYGR